MFAMHGDLDGSKGQLMDVRTDRYMCLCAQVCHHTEKKNTCLTFSSAWTEAVNYTACCCRIDWYSDKFCH